MLTSYEPTIITSLIGVFGLVITLLVLSVSNRAVHRRELSVREQYFAAMAADDSGCMWQDPDFLDDEEMLLQIEAMKK